MFGVTRTVLAFMVVAGHLYGPAASGLYAVFAFYLISGFLMTTIMHDVYKYNHVGRIRFIINRFLRLYPIYWSAMLFSLIIIYLFDGNEIIQYNPAMFTPTDFSDWSSNITMIFWGWFPHETTPRLVPPTWALTVEMSFYLLICIGISSTLRSTLIWFLISIMYMLYTYVAGLSWESRYYPIAAASLPFSIGSLFYFLIKRKFLIGLIKTKYFAPHYLLAAMFLNLLFSYSMSYYFNDTNLVYNVGFFSNLIIAIALLGSIAYGNSIPHISKANDKIIGDLSYPIYLIHLQVGILISYIIFDKPIHGHSIESFIVFVVSSISVVLFSFILIRMIDYPVQILRDSIRDR